MEDRRLSKLMKFGELVGGQEKEFMGCLLDDLRVFGFDPDKRTIAAQDEGEWLRTAKTSGREFHDEMDRGKESQGSITACRNILEGDGKDRREGSPKQACSYRCARSSWSATVAQTMRYYVSMALSVSYRGFCQ